MLFAMARSIRIEFEGALYHIMARGNRREAIFLDDEDRRIFLHSLGEACGMTGWRVHAWVLMGNHYHLMIETPEANLVEGMKWLQNAYTRRFNVRHTQWGRLFGDRYKSVLVEGEGYYYETLMDYIHLNPARATLINPLAGQGLLHYSWSSLAAGYVLGPKKRAKWLAAADGLRSFGFADTVSGRKGFVERLERRLLAEGLERSGIPVLATEMDKRLSNLEKGWYWGSREFAERMLKIGESVLKKPRHAGDLSAPEIRAHGEQEAKRLIAEGLTAAGLGAEDLPNRPGSDPIKAVLAEIVWSRTSVNMEWIAQALKMRSAGNVRQQIRRRKAGQFTQRATKAEQHWTTEFRKWRKQSQLPA
jgi:putative transposase